MKFGVREICEVVLRAKSAMKIGTKQFYKGEPVLYFDTLKTSSFEGSSTTVYATGGRGNARLMSWDGEKTTTFTMEDALISPEGLMILAGAGLIDASEKTIYQHMTKIVAKEDVTIASGGKSFTAKLNDAEGNPIANVVTGDKSQDTIYVMLMKDGEVISEPYIGTWADGVVSVANIAIGNRTAGAYSVATAVAESDFDSVMVDFYVSVTKKGASQINITPDSFGGSFYLEASTLWRNEAGMDVPAEFIIPNCRVQSNFSFSMASSGDPSTFTFTLDCFPDYTRWDPTEKVLAAIQVIPDTADNEQYRAQTDANAKLAYEPAQG